MIEGFDYLTAPPHSMVYENGEIWIFYPQGMICLNEDFSATDRTIWSFFLSSTQEWEISHKAFIYDDTLLWMDVHGTLGSRNIYSQQWTERWSTTDEPARFFIVDKDRLLIQNQNGQWNLLIHDGQWISQELPWISPLALYLPGGAAPEFYDPMTNQLYTVQGISMKLQPAPEEMVYQGIILNDGYRFWNQDRLYHYDTSGQQINNEVLPLHFPLLAAPNHEGVYLLEPFGSTLIYRDSHGELALSWNSQQMEVLFIEFLPLLLADQQVENHKRALLGWSLEQVNKLYAENPLNRELAVLRNDLEEMLKTFSLY